MKRVNEIGTIYSLVSIISLQWIYVVYLNQGRITYICPTSCRSMVACYIQFVHKHSHNNIIMMLCRLPETNTSSFGAKAESSERPTKKKQRVSPYHTEYLHASKGA